MATNESIRVIARFRPSFEVEQKSQNTRKIDLQVTGKGKLLSVYGKEQHQHKNYSFDEVMDEKTKPAIVFTKIAQPICDGIIQGYNGTIITYGQSGSGKTFCMYGPEEKQNSMNPELVGIIPRSICYIFEILNNKHHSAIEGMLSYEVKCEFLEIQCNQLKDLLNLKNTPQIKERCVNSKNDEWKMFTTNTEKVEVKNCKELLKKLYMALELNGRSTRSHMIMNLFVSIQMDSSERTSICRFIDLQGSEKMTEPLSKIIEDLVDKKQASFTDSELTYLLKNSLGGNCKTAFIVCCSPDLSHINETIRSLNFGVRCRTIQNYPKQNKELKDHYLRIQCDEQEKKIKDLKKKIKGLEYGNQEYVNIDNEQSVKAEKQQFMNTIKELQKAIKKQSDQISELGQEKLIMDKAMEKHNNDVKNMEFKNNELKTNLDEKDKEIYTLKGQINNSENINKQLVSDNEQLKVTNEQLKVYNGILTENKDEQLIEINKLKTEQIQLQNEQEKELDNNKSKFSEHEMELSQIIDSLKKQLQRKDEELADIHYKLKEKQDNMYKLKDEIRNINQNLKEEKNNSKQLQTTNEQLLCDLEKHVKIIKNLNSEINEQNNIFEQQKSQIKELLLNIETNKNEFESSNNTIEQMKKQHVTEINDLRYKLGNMTESNQELEEENKIFEIQSKELQHIYHEVVQQQIKDDHKLAEELQTKETKQLIERKKKIKNKGGYIDSDDETNDNSIQITPGMATEIVKKFAHDDEINDDMKNDEINDDMKHDEQNDEINDVKHDEINDDNHVEHNEKGDNVLIQKKKSQMNEDFEIAKAIYQSQIYEHNEHHSQT